MTQFNRCKNLMDQELNSEFQAFFKHKFTSTRDVSQQYLELIVKASQSEIGYLHLYNANTQEIKLNVWSQKVLDMCATTHDSHYPIKEAGIWADCIRQDHYVIHNDYPNQASNAGLPSGHFPLTRHMSFPVKVKGEIVAVIGVGNAISAYTQETACYINQIIQDTVAKVSFKIEQIKDQAEAMKREFNETPNEEILIDMLEAISKALEMHDVYTTHHQQKVSKISERIAEKLELPQQQITGLVIGALIHDIGKISIPTQILNKVNKLHAVEYELLKLHTTNGSAILKGVKSPWPIFEMINQHHERLDGTGYPLGLTSKQICIEAKIIAVADTFDAMASDRPYRYAQGADKAIAELKLNRGIKYDHYVVDAFMSCYNDDATFGGLYNPPPR
ncbi:phosphohydrolase [Saccharobesus litoralis]|uniref:Phosphohydrolase n=1 Tax=Saccharobesus litoralis TaxID=2172099 RepID=A0A2S0VWC0_9ALTE|nr:HD domain-containing phosphohydrolase [Saccharobesus litoralis]AWB68511.1 phosphohydrolase [Saccharobesus litoralis]